MPPATEYPSVSEYRDALQHPRKCFRLAELQAAAPELDRMKLPCPQTGGRAAVFRLDVAGSAVALKVFKYEVPRRQQRYQAISDHLGKLKCQYLVDFTYVAEGIRVPRGAETFGQAKWYPTLAMPWVSGVLLKPWLEEQVARRDAAAVLRFADRFAEMIAELKSHGIAHGDLQHGNVKVIAGAPMLVDYDGMFVPSLANEPAEEVGLPGYQHPRREALHWWSPELDDFSAWVVWLSLRAIAADFGLWSRMAETETLLFAPEDLAAPDTSAVWRDLLRSPDKAVAARADVLFASLRPPFRVPPFLFDRARRLRELCAVKEWDGIDREAADLTRQDVPVPAELAAMVSRARVLVDERRRLEDALKSGDPRRVVAVLRAGLERDWPACAALVAQAKRAIPQAAALDELDAALTPPGDDVAFAALWRRHVATLAGVPGTHRYAFLAAVAAPVSERAVVEAWAALAAAGGHPTIPNPHPRVQLAQRRLPLLAAVAASERTVDERADRAFVAAYRPADLADCAEAGELGRWYAQAKERVARLDYLHSLLAAGVGATKPEVYFERVRDAALALPADYPHTKAKDVAEAQAWLRERDRLRLACVAARWDEAAALAGGDVFARLPLPADLADVARNAIERSEARRRLDAALAAGSLGRAAAAYRPELLDDWPECAGLLARARRARALASALRQIQAEAAEPGDGRKLVQLWQTYAAELSAWKEGPALREQAEAWRARIEARDALERLIREPRPAATALAEAWRKVQDAGGHPDAEAWRPRATRAVACAACMAELRRVPAEPSESADRLFDAAWRDDVLAGWWEAEAWLPRLSVVRFRLNVLMKLEEPLKKGDDLAIVQVAVRLPPAYRFEHPARQARVAEARQRADSLMELLKAHAERRWDDVARLAASIQGVTWPDDLRAKVDEAVARTRARQGLRAALGVASLEQVAAEYRPELLDDWPECAGDVERARAAARLLPALRLLRQEAAAPGDGRRLVNLWRAHGADLSAWKDAAPLAAAARTWEARLVALAEIERLAQGDDVTAEAFVLAWSRLQAAGGHPAAERWRALGQQMQQRADCLAALRAIADAPGEAADRAFAEAWREDELRGSWEGDALRPRLVAVRARLLTLASMAAAKTEDRLAELAATLPEGYAFDRPMRGVVAKGRLRAGLRAALDERPVSDVTLAEAHDAFAAGGGKLDGDDARRCELAQVRRRALIELRRTPNATDETTLRLWKQGQLHDCADVTDAERVRFGTAARRTAGALKLREAVEAGDFERVRALAADSSLAAYPPADKMLALADKVRAALDCLTHDLDDAEFARLDVDLSCVAECRATFRPHADRLAALLRRELAGVRLSAQGERSGDAVVVRWTTGTWRTFGLGEWACKLVVSASPLPADLGGVSATLVTASVYRADVSPTATRVYVAVWPVLRLDALDVEASGPALRLTADVSRPAGWRGLLGRLMPKE